MPLVTGIETLLTGTAAVTALLATHDFDGVADAPAIFTVDPIPRDAAHPALNIVQVSGETWGTLDKRGAEADVDVTVWDNKVISTKNLRALAQILWRTLDWATPIVAGYEEIGMWADPPRFVHDPDGFPGFVISCTCRILET